MDRLRELYRQYYYSLPTERWMSKRKHRFKAKPLDEMTELEMMAGMNRDEAERELEEYFNESVKNGTLTWDDSWGSWFYQDKEISTLILLKEWFVKESVA